MSRIWPLIAGIILHGTVAQPTVATTADDICEPMANPCVVSTMVTLTADSTLDFGGRELQIADGGGFRIEASSLTVRAGRVSTAPNSLIRTSGRTRADPAASLEIEAAEILLAGEIDTRGSPAGSITLTSTGPLAVSGRIRGSAEAADASAASLDFAGTTVIVSASIDASGGREDAGGDFTVTGVEITLLGGTDISGGEGGTAEISATESLTLGVNSMIQADATTAAGDGGDVTISADGDVEIRGRVSTKGRAGGDDGGGDGGPITVGGDNSVTVAADATLDASGSSPDGLGGDIEVSSFLGHILVAGRIMSVSDDRDGLGGGIDISADGTTRISGTLDARGALGGGGDIALSSDALNVVVDAEGVVDASTTRDAEAGTIRIVAATRFTHAGRIIANSSQVDSGAGGAIFIDACGVDLAANSEVRSRGPGGSNSIQSGALIAIQGTLFAGPASGANILRFAAAGPTPAIASNTLVTPAATMIADPELLPCDPAPPTKTPIPTRTPPSTTVPTASPSNTPTTTTVPSATSSNPPKPSPTLASPPCPGDCDGNGTVQIAELIRAVNIALGTSSLETCRAADSDGDGQVRINDLVRAVNAALGGCP